MPKMVTIIRCMALLSVLLLLSACSGSSQSGQVLDEARQAGRDAASFRHAEEDYFHDMDRGIPLTPDEVKGRNMWLVWSGGNDRFWDKMNFYTYGSFDLLKIVTSHPTQTDFNTRDKRWKRLGLINEPCFNDTAGPDPNRFGLYLDARDANCAPDPFENETKYPGVKFGARGTTFADGKTLPVGSYYGYATGILGLRLFPNPDFDEAAEKNWDAEKYYTDPTYYNNPKLVRPYRVGMSCGFCHLGPNPVHPPADPAHPQMADLSSTVGAQYMWVDRLFIYSAEQTNFMYQLVHTYRPGSMDTSLVSTDSINNPRTMNAVYNLGARLGIGPRIGQEKLAGGGLNNKQFNDFARTAALNDLFQKPDSVLTPHVLKDGADSVGALGALNRVYLNIGLFSEEWLLHFNPVVGGKDDQPDPDRRRAKRIRAIGRRPRRGRRTPRCSSSNPPGRTGSRTRPAARKFSPPIHRRRSTAARPCSPRPVRDAIPARRRRSRRTAQSRTVSDRVISTASSAIGRIPRPPTTRR